MHSSRRLVEEGRVAKDNNNTVTWIKLDSKKADSDVLLKLWVDKWLQGSIATAN